MRLICTAVMLGAAALAGAAELAGAATPAASAPAAKASSVPELQAGPVAVGKLRQFRGYRMVVDAAQRGGGRALVVVQLVRTKGGAAQTIGYTFDVPGRALRIGRRLRYATLDTRSALGRFGRIRLTFSCRRRQAGDSRRGCAGSRRGRSGRLIGVLDVRTEFGVRIRLRSLPAKLMLRKAPLTSPSVGTSPSCGQYRHSSVLAVGPVATATSHNFGLGGFLAVRAGAGPIRLLVGVIRSRPPAVENAGIESPAPRSALRLTGTRSARVDGSGVPFFRGRLAFSRAAPFPGCPNRAAVGTAAGSLRARFDFFGTVPLLKMGRAAPAILIAPVPR